jgi:hypothetical protein
MDEGEDSLLLPKTVREEYCAVNCLARGMNSSANLRILIASFHLLQPCPAVRPSERIRVMEEGRHKWANEYNVFLPFIDGRRNSAKFPSIFFCWEANMNEAAHRIRAQLRHRFERGEPFG